ncbi:MAG: hypothetical protein IKV46_05455 [Bacteroidales bacterium]|jgi:hypothetical protein|nr:hypothetical protein [Bacteroidales bacterium]
MNKKVLIIEIVILVVLTTINFFLFFNKNQEKQCNTDNCVNAECYLSHEISLNEEQKLQYEKIKAKYQQQAILIADSLHISQEYLMRNLMNENQDTLKIKEIESVISRCQAELLHISVNQYNDIKSILTPSQIPALDKLFSRIFICRPTCNHRKEDAGTHPHIN